MRRLSRRVDSEIITSETNSIQISKCEVTFRIYQGAPVIARSVLFWNRWIILRSELKI